MRFRLPCRLLLAAATFVAGCGGVDAPPVVELGKREGVDADAAALVRKMAAEARLDPENVDRRVELALAYEGNEFWDECARAWGDALALDPDQPVWRYHRSVCLRKHGDDEASLAELRRTIAESPDLAAARFDLGELLLDADELDAAQAEFEAAVRIAPHLPDPYVALAEVLIRKEDYARAVELCRKAIEIDPGGRRAHYALGLAYQGLRRLDEAERELTLGQNAVKRPLMDPFSTRLEAYRVSFMLRFNRAMNLDSAGQTAAAVKIFEDLLKTHPNKPELLNNLAAAYSQLGKHDGARTLLFRARDLDPDGFATYINLAAVEIASNDLPKALEYADKAVELAPSMAQARVTRAGVYVQAQRHEEAYADLKLAAGFDASNGMVFGRLGEAAMATGRLREAVEHFERAAGLMPDSLPAQASLAKACFKVGQRDKALAAYERARKLAPDNAELRALGAEIGAPPR